MAGEADTPQVQISERAVLRKFDGDWTDEQMANGEAQAAGALAEAIVVIDGQIVDRWHRGEERDAPEA
jgi:hypothetical protein